MSARLNVAVVGGGIAGIAAAHRLSAEHSVTLFEASESLGGHAHAITFDLDNRSVTVDTAFLIFNTGTYPFFCSFLRELGVVDRMIPAEMSSCFFSDDVAYSLGLPKTVIKAHSLDFLRLKFLSIFFDLWRFRRRAAKDVRNPSVLREISIGKYLRSYGTSFCENFALPLMAAIWSVPSEDVEEHPAASILNYFANHSLLSGRSKRLWQTFDGSSQVYLDAFMQKFSGRICTNSPITKIVRDPHQCTLAGAEGHIGSFDRVVLATHADTSLALLDSPTESERRLLGLWKYRNQKAILHTDANVLHRDPDYWSSWNMRRIGKKYYISYYLNRLQRLDAHIPVILSLGEQSIAETAVIEKFEYRHPIFDEASVSAQPTLPCLNRGISAFCGSYFGYGFHEDAYRSGLAAAESLCERVKN